MRNTIIDTHYRQNYKRLVKTIARRFGGNTHLAEEAVQEAYTKAVKYFKLFDPDKKPFNAWFTSILNNAVRDLQRQEMHRGAIKEGEELELIPDPRNQEETTHWDEIRRHINSDIDTLSNETHQEVLELYFNKGMQPTEICEIIEGVSREAAKKIIQRFRPFILDKYAVA